MLGGECGENRGNKRESFQGPKNYLSFAEGKITKTSA